MTLPLNQLHLGDCHTIMAAWPAASIDLIYLDPPYGSQRDYGAFDDRWPSFEAYLDYMRPRLEQCHRLLKPTGSLYLHCDPTASHYLKVMLDTIFGRANFQNHITWQRTRGNKQTMRAFPHNSDHILFYALPDAPFAKPYNGLLGAKFLQNFRQQDADGRPWRRDDISAPGGYGYKYKLGYDERTPSRGYRMPKKTAERWLREGRLIITAGQVPSYKRYLDECRGSTVSDCWNDLEVVKVMSNEGVGYPTQKPLALLTRIILASSNEGDLVLDPFCGSGTTIVAAARLGRQWLGIDRNSDALALVKQRLNEQTMPLTQAQAQD